MTTPIPRTQDEIRAQFTASRDRDFFGTEGQHLVEAMTFETAKAADIPKDDVTPDQWATARCLYTVEDVKAEILSYLIFAWDKANNCRGLSANRSLEHFRGWCWLLGAEGQAIMEHPDFNVNYRHYGKAALVRVSELVGFDWRAHDNDEWVNNEGESGITADQALGR